MSDIKQTIHEKVVELAAQLGNDARSLKYDQAIPPAGLLDSAALMELIVWFETTYDLSIEQNEITMDNFGTIDAMASFWERNGGKPSGVNV
jgi:D-alanine--poly(phosphoribitol) ligase subunit 2